ncbi:CubicO group peptidase, beta-lactamase class C family [Virgibacillus subterraneus]|uniref:CubicO group peptidase, beta-lactamase class C family n=1 Tax=Virgibacillus subterraneus TaxID=621109 RepID=A0A1H9L5T5_9BACI|nr:serine hydrolase domain-containing protein [Virgibacillus subterraneus]SER06842.1 CubicO group peptidase, beta-lactamase class C family [Virgibacillus subterraneus]
MEIPKQKVQKIFGNVTKKRQIHESVLLIENSSGDVSYSLGYGDKDADTPFLMASITKLFTTTCIFILRDQGKLSLDDEITKYLKKDTISNLHVYKGREYSDQLTISNLLSQTSGLRDAIEEGSNESKKRAIYEDVLTNFNESIIETKKIQPHFAPGMGKRAHYTNINFEILGKIIEIVTRSPLEDVYRQFIFDPLGHKNTYLPQNEDDFVPHVYYKDTALYRPKLLKSSCASGGCVSTARELMVFLKAFFRGKLFNNTIFHELKVNNRLQASMLPIHYGAGYMRIPLNGLATLFMGKGELIGHSGSTGSLAFYYPEKDLFFIGDVNQMENPATPVRMVMRLAMSMKS